MRPSVRDLPDPNAVELSARLVDVIEVPYVKPTGPRRPRVRVGCPIVWPSDMKSSVGDSVMGPKPEPRTIVAPIDSLASAVHAGRRITVEWPTVIGGAVTAVAYVLGRVATGGPHAVATSFAVGLALLLTFVVATGVVRGATLSGRLARAVAAAGCVLVLMAAVSGGALKLLSG